MSKFSHRQPVWTWSSVVILSTLLLSPVATSALLRTLAQALPQNFGAWTNVPTPEGTPPERNTASQTPPRRSVEEEEALRAAARSGQVRAVRLDSDPDNADAAIALFFPSRAIVRLPDTGATAARYRWDASPLFSTWRIAAPPRAPPA
jgi:hypothetical protein